MEDRNQAIEILNSYFKQMNFINKPTSYIFKPKAAKQFIDIYYRLQETQRVYFKALYQDNEILSMLLCRTEKNPFVEKEKFIFIEFAITKTAHRKKGYMKHLLEDLEKFAIEQEISNLQLKVFSFEPRID